MRNLPLSYKRWLPRVPALRSRLFSTSPPETTARLIHEPFEEELLSDDRVKYFHPTRPGEILDGGYRTIAKLGFGIGPTVWLAENLEL